MDSRSLPDIAPIDELVRATDTLATLRARHGADNVREETLPGAEGQAHRGWTLFGSQPARRLEIHLDESGRPASVYADREATAWRSADGVHIGLDSTQLAALNGGPFEFWGFDWDYGGYVSSWEGGRLDRGAASTKVRLCAPENAPADYPAGDSPVMSDDPRLVRTPARICEFAVPAARR